MEDFKLEDAPFSPDNTLLLMAPPSLPGDPIPFGGYKNANRVQAIGIFTRMTLPFYGGRSSAISFRQAMATSIPRWPDRFARVWEQLEGSDDKTLDLIAVFRLADRSIQLALHYPRCKFISSYIEIDTLNPGGSSMVHEHAVLLAPETHNVTEQLRTLNP